MPHGGKRANSGGKRPGSGRPKASDPKIEETLQGARRRKERALADLREIEVHLKRGTLLEAVAVEKAWTDMMRRLQSGILAVTSRLRQQLLHLTPRDIQVIDRELRDALAALALPAGDQDGDGGPPVDAERVA